MKKISLCMTTLAPSMRFSNVKNHFQLRTSHCTVTLHLWRINNNIQYSAHGAINTSRNFVDIIIQKLMEFYIDLKQVYSITIDNNSNMLCVVPINGKNYCYRNLKKSILTMKFF